MPDLNPTTPPSSADATPGDMSNRPAATPLAELGQAGGPRPFPGRARAGNEISVLFPLLTLYTAAYLALMAAEFFLRGAFTIPAGMMPVYIALLGAYAVDKEVRRWVGAAEPPRKGSVFVYLWLLFFLGAFLLASFRPEFVLPDELGKVVLQVLGIFFGSKASKHRLADMSRIWRIYGAYGVYLARIWRVSGGYKPYAPGWQYNLRGLQKQ